MSGLEFALGLGGALLSSAGALSQGRAQASALNAQASELEAQAERERQSAAADASLATEEAERTIGAAQAIAAASGFDVSGSARDVLADLAGQKRYNASALIYAGDLERRALLAQAGGLRRSAKASKRQGLLAAGATLLTGGYRLTQIDRAPAYLPGRSAGAVLPGGRGGRG